MKIDIAIIGAQKAGTTSLFKFLKTHPAIRGHEQRELTFFFYDEEFARGERKGLARYFPDQRPEALSNLTHVVKHVFLMRSRQALERLRNHNPDCRLVCVLRDPVTRAYSAYLHARRRGWQDSRVPFSAVAARQMEQYLAGHGVEDPKLDYVRNGCYIDDLTCVMDIFPRGSLYVMFAENLARDPAGETNRFLAWAGQAPLAEGSIGDRHNVQRNARSESLARILNRVERSRVLRLARMFIPVRARYKLHYAVTALNERPGRSPPIDTLTQEMLEGFYQAKNLELSRWLGLVDSLWAKSENERSVLALEAEQGGNR